ncbi:uncharacterized protein LOC125032921 [Penaeus chinensis]|uniref:uncharacterized protein LOC125032921 n=1 Tax=Penaeus chinensis TaxID=139456 RepID=UPI001FB7AAE0|nr:uncharacterized protein LOC125032921 [Penaeus chinensis]
MVRQHPGKPIVPPFQRIICSGQIIFHSLISVPSLLGKFPKDFHVPMNLLANVGLLGIFCELQKPINLGNFVEKEQRHLERIILDASPDRLAQVEMASSNLSENSSGRLSLMPSQNLLLLPLDCMINHGEYAVTPRTTFYYIYLQYFLGTIHRRTDVIPPKYAWSVHCCL